MYCTCVCVCVCVCVCPCVRGWFLPSSLAADFRQLAADGPFPRPIARPILVIFVAFFVHRGGFSSFLSFSRRFPSVGQAVALLCEKPWVKQRGRFLSPWVKQRRGLMLQGQGTQQVPYLFTHIWAVNISTRNANSTQGHPAGLSCTSSQGEITFPYCVPWSASPECMVSVKFEISFESRQDQLRVRDQLRVEARPASCARSA